jgi:hypothetical protein
MFHLTGEASSANLVAAQIYGGTFRRWTLKTSRRSELAFLKFVENYLRGIQFRNT